MTKKLEETFGFLPDNSPDVDNDITAAYEEEIPENIKTEMAVATATIAMVDRVDIALPTVTDMKEAERELDSLANKAQEQSERLMDLGFNVDDRNAGKIFEVAAQLLKTAVDAKTAKIDKKLRMVELQLRKARLDIPKDNSGIIESNDTSVLSNRNDLLQAILNRADRNK